MKRISVVLIFVLAFITLKAQTSSEEIDYVQAMFGMEKRAAVKEFIELSDAEAKAFWKNYDAYEVTRKEMGKERIELLEKFVLEFDQMTDQESIKWMKSVMSLRERNEKLIEKYYKLLVKECSPLIAMQFYQIESYVLAGIRFQILENAPF